MSALIRLIVWCLIIYVFPIYVRAFFVTPSHFLFTSVASDSSATLPFNILLYHPLGPSLFLIFFSILLGPWAHLYACSVAQRTYCDRGDTWVLKNASLPRVLRVHPISSLQPPTLYHPDGPRPIYWHQSTKHYYLDAFTESQSKMALCTSCFGPILPGVSVLMPSMPCTPYYPHLGRRTAFY